MSRTEFITRLLEEFENRLERCTMCRACVAGITAALEFAVAEAAGLAAGSADGESQARDSGSRDFAIRGYLQAIMPWEKIHV